MALADIIERIEADAGTEASQHAAAALERAETVLAAARAQAEANSAQLIGAAERDAARDAQTIVVNARLRGRDALVAAQRELIDETLADAAQRIAEMPDADYAHFMAKRIVGIARPGDTLSIGTLDAARGAAMTAVVRELAPGLELILADSPAPFERGALLTGPRVRADLSLPVIVGDRRDELELVAAATLFGEGA